MSAKISVIIPTYNEVDTVIKCIKRLQKYGRNAEVIIADSPESSVNLPSFLTKLDCTYFVCKKGGRNHQMNEGAEMASSQILYFVHADTCVHEDYESDILNTLKSNFDLGCYSYKFDKYPNPLMYINSLFTRLPMIWCRGGDQTLFLKKSVFESLNGFCDEHIIMEDYDFLERAKEKGFRFKLLPKNVVVSSRKYAKNGYFKVQLANLKVMRKWLKGTASPQELLNYYRTVLE